MFTVENNKREGFFKGTTDLGGYVGGTVTDNSGIRFRTSSSGCFTAA